MSAAVVVRVERECEMVIVWSGAAQRAGGRIVLRLGARAAGQLGRTGRRDD